MDLQKPSGLFFALVGGILVIAGVAMPDSRAPLTSVNVNLYAGIAMLLFGGVMLWLSKQQL
ncbi:MAG: hypothetical protein ACRD7E_15230 [Bryobacteraceae bacterium]